MSWAAADTRDAGTFSVRLMDAVIAEDEALLTTMCAALWSDVQFHAAVMTMLPKPVRTYLYENIATYDKGFRADNWGTK